MPSINLPELKEELKTRIFRQVLQFVLSLLLKAQINIVITNCQWDSTMSRKISLMIIHYCLITNNR